MAVNIVVRVGFEACEIELVRLGHDSAVVEPMQIGTSGLEAQQAVVLT